MSDAETHILWRIRTWVWSGFYDREDVLLMLDDVLEPSVDADQMRAAVRKEFREKLVAERGWPAVTDPDRLSSAFDELDAQGICALQNAGVTQSDGYNDVLHAITGKEAKYRGYCFFHEQDLERAIAGQGLYIAFGLIDTGSRDVELGKSVHRALVNQGFVVDWDETAKTRILVRNIEWLRRRN